MRFRNGEDQSQATVGSCHQLIPIGLALPAVSKMGQGWVGGGAAA